MTSHWHTPSKAAILLLLAALWAAAAVPLARGQARALGRTLQASDPGPKQPECSGHLTEEWSHDHIECHYPSCEGNPQLKCILHGGIIRNPFISCELDASIFSSAITWDCPVSSTNNTVMCDWRAVQGKVSGCDWPITQRILTAWTHS